MANPKIFPINPFQEQPDRVLAAGDWHGNTHRAASVIQSAGMREIPVVLQLGDFGFWTPGPDTDRYLDAVNAACEQWNVVLLWVDGNHECFPHLNALPINEIGARPIREHVVHLPRGFRWSWHGRRWMALGGAHSVDKHLRTLGRSWWPEEYLSDSDLDTAIAGGPVDVIAAHDCPDQVHIPGLAPDGFFPAAQIADAEAHRYLVGRVVDATKPGVLVHGHYHRRYNAVRPLPGGDRQTAIIGLADDGAPFRDGMLLLDLAAGDTLAPANLF